MEHSIKMEKTCRTCLRSPDMLLPLFEDEQLSEKIETVTSVQICKTDQLPTEICAECVININLAYSFRRVVINSDRELKRRITSLFVPDDITIDEIKLDQSNDISEPESVEDLLMENGSDMEDKPVETEIIMKDSTKIELETGLNLEEGSNNKLKVDLVKDYFYKCKVCNFRTPDYAEYKDHLKTKLQVPKSVCSICGKSIRADNLNRHMTIHTEPPVQCKHCGKTCKNTESLRGHLFIHKNVKLKCKICGKVYTYRSGFRQHIKRHTLGDVKTVPCSICSKQFYDKQTMDKHIRSHTGERPYPCEYCKKGFSSSYALKTHKRRHTNEKPYLCEFCPMAFPQKVSLRTHYKSKHPEATDRT